jgi:Domain of unknown function (DUF397)
MNYADAATALSQAAGWFTSSRTGQGQNCVEVTTAVAGWVGVRDTKNRAAGLLALNRQQWTTFLNAVHEGQLAR